MRRHAKASSAGTTMGTTGALLCAVGVLLAIALAPASASAACPNAVFRTGPSAKLPECRAYELVTPPFTGGLTPSYEPFLQDVHGMFATDTVTSAGDSVVYQTVGGALTGYPGTGHIDRYRARRTAEGWRTEAISPGGTLSAGGGPGGISPDHEYAVERAIQPSDELWPGLGGRNFTDVIRTPSGYEPVGLGSLGFAEAANAKWVTAGGTHIIFTTSERPLEPEAPQHSTQVGGETIYDRTPGGPTHIVSRLPDGEPIKDARFLGTTKDGSEVAFGPSSMRPGEDPIYVRRNNVVTEEVVRPGGVVVGKELTCSGGPGGATLEYQWLRNGTPIGSATNTTYTTTAADEGAVIQCQVTASNSEGTSVRTSAIWVVDPYQGKTFPHLGAPVIPEGSTSSPLSVTVGTPLRCRPPQAGTAGFTADYQWLRDGTAIGGATSSTYTPLEVEVGHSLQCRATVTNSNGTVVSYSNPVSIYVEGPAASADPAISNVTHPGNAPEIGDELSCSEGTWSGSPTFAYQWLRNGAEIAGATSSTYAVVAADETRALQCQVTATNAGGSRQAVSDQVFFGSSASVNEIRPFLETFGSANQPSFNSATSIAVDQSSGDLLVLDPQAATISRWKPDGTPDNFSALGTNVIDGKGALDGTPPSEGLSPFTVPAAAQVAVDNSGGATNGNIYVTNNYPSRVDIFSSTGAFIGELKESSGGSFQEVCGVAVDPSGSVYVGDYVTGKIYKYVPSGSVPVKADNTASFSYPEVCTLATGAGASAGYIFAAKYEGALDKLDSSTGEVKSTLLPSGAITESVDPSTGHVYAITGSDFQEFDASGVLVSKTALSGPRGIAGREFAKVYVTAPSGTHVSVYGSPMIEPAPVPPERTSPGRVLGKPQVGESLSCGSGSWSENPSFTRQWLRDGAEIAGATSFEYKLTAADLEKMIQCRVTATSAGGSTVAIDAGEMLGNEEVRMVVTRAVPEASAEQQPTPGFTFGGIFNGRVFYSDAYTEQADEWTANPGDLYMYDLNEEKTTRITDTGNAILVNVSEDGSHAYFVSRSPIGGEGEAGKPNLGVYSVADGTSKFIATLAEKDVAREAAGYNQRPSLAAWSASLWSSQMDRGKAMVHDRSTPDGKVFAFESTARLTSFDNTEASAEDCGEPEVGYPNPAGEGCDEVYRYDTASEELTCVSCGPGTGPATGYGVLQSVSHGGGLGDPYVEPATVNVPVESLTEDGNTVFFESTEGLLPQDGNETKDVYRWKEGSGLALISTGQDLGESALYAVTPNGSDVIFGTRGKLVPQDENGMTVRFYDARVDGGFPPPEETVTVPCAGDGCQGAPSASPEAPQISSQSLEGGGNLPRKLRCGKGRREVVRHGVERCVKRRRNRHRRAGSKRRVGR